MDKEQLEHLRHSCAHLLAAAVQELYPEAKRTIGPPIENGFYYDFDFLDTKISEDDLAKIEEKMREAVKSWKGFEKKEVSIDEAKQYFADNEYKCELITEFSEEGKMLTFYSCGNFTDLCKGGHSENPSEDLKHFKLLSVAGAYWRGNENNKMLTRIYGTAFPSAEELQNHLTMLEEAKKRDHRKLGKELGLFVFSDLVGPGLPLFTPKGCIVRNQIIGYSRELNGQIGFEEVQTPNMNKAELFKVSGHYDKYKDDMLEVKSHYSEEPYYLKPMNCPQHTQIYASQTRSYRDLPLRFADFANLYRDERPGELSGLTRLRCFAQDDGHIFCREDQIQSEFNQVLGVVKQALQTYGLNYWIRLSLRDPNEKEKYLGDDALWENAQTIMRKLLQENNIEFKEAEGEAAFYGPKMDIMAKDSIGREWQISTIQLDFNMPGRFGLVYADQDGTEKTPVMIHRAIVGSPERFMGVLIEHYAGAFPVWLSPVQVRILPVSNDKHLVGANSLKAELLAAGIRVEVDSVDETVGNKIRKAAGAKVPYVLVVGDKELAGEPLMVRVRGQEEQEKMEKDLFMQRVVKEIAERL
jgi:threonyl-tRNA synthetase